MNISFSYNKNTKVISYKIFEPDPECMSRNYSGRIIENDYDMDEHKSILCISNQFSFKYYGIDSFFNDLTDILNKSIQSIVNIAHIFDNGHDDALSDMEDEDMSLLWDNGTLLCMDIIEYSLLGINALIKKIKTNKDDYYDYSEPFNNYPSSDLYNNITCCINLFLKAVLYYFNINDGFEEKTAIYEIVLNGNRKIKDTIFNYSLF